MRAALLFAIVLAAAPAHAQVVDTVTLGSLQTTARDNDPRRAHFELLELADSLAARNEVTSMFPQLSIAGRAQYQSDVIALPFSPPDGSARGVPHDSYEAYLNVRQPILDPSRSARRQLREAEYLQGQARTEVSLYAQRRVVNEAYFNALSAQLQRAEVDASARALEAQLQLARDRVSLGAALPSEAAMLEAALLMRRQASDALAAGRTAALSILQNLTGRRMDSTTVLVLPELAQLVEEASANPGDFNERPEYEQFNGRRALLDAQSTMAASQSMPRITGFGRAGYGRPALNPLSTEFETYWLAGVQVEWNPWDWGDSQRERAQLEAQRRMVLSDEAAFTESLQRATSTELIEAARIAGALGTSERIVELRDAVLQETRIRMEEGVVTSADYVNRDAELLAARLTLALHRVELAGAYARYLTLAGMEVSR